MTRLRIAIFSVLLGCPFVALEGRIFYMQILNAAEYRSRADWTRSWVEVVPTPRGQIRDRNGEIMAAEERCFDLDLVLADFELPRQKGKDPALDYGKLGKLLREILALLKVADGFDPAAAGRMLKSRICPIRPTVRADGKPDTGPDVEAIAGMLQLGETRPRPEAVQMYLKALKVFRQVDRAVQRRTTNPDKPVSAHDRRAIMRQEWRQPYRLWTGLTFDQVSEVAIDEDRFPALEIRQRTRRTYPAGRNACHVVGYSGQMGEEEYQKRESSGDFRKEMDGLLTDEEYERLEYRGAFYGDWVGRDGIELMYDADLAGRRGVERRAKNLLSHKEWVVDRVAPVPGKDVALTIDLRLQRRAEELLDTLPLGLRGSIVVLDARTGEVLALASAPGYDVNWLVPPIGKEEWAALTDPVTTPMLDRAIAGRYPLGSIFKAVTGAAGLESGKVTLADHFLCQGRYDPVKFPGKFACWIAAHGGAHGELDIRDALARSCNCFFFETGNRAGIEAVSEMAGLFGLGRKTGIDLPHEVAGLIPTPAWRRAAGRGRWGISDTLNVSIGQGEVLVSPIQAARLMAGFATGRLPVPRLRLDAESRWEDLPLSPATFAAIRAGLEAVTMETYGTGYPSALRLFKAAGKTSTAQASSREQGQENHGWFAGYAPADNPRYAFCIMIEHGGAGSGLPARTASRLLQAIWPEVQLPGDSTPALPEAHDHAPAEEQQTPGPAVPGGRDE